MKKILFSLFLFFLSLAFVFTIVTKKSTKQLSSLTHPSVYLNNNPEDFYKKQCAFCHESDELIAPNMKEIKKVYLDKYPKKEDFIKAMLGFVKNPTKEKAIYKKGLQKYTLMPKMPFKESDLKGVIEYIYNKI